MKDSPGSPPSRTYFTSGISRPARPLFLSSPALPVFISLPLLGRQVYFVGEGWGARGGVEVCIFSPLNVYKYFSVSFLGVFINILKKVWNYVKKQWQLITEQFCKNKVRILNELLE